MNYRDFARLPASEKITLVTVEANTQLKLWEEVGGIYSRDVDQFVVKCKAGDTTLERVESIEEIGEGKWFFDPVGLKLYTGPVEGISPAHYEFVCTYKFFFSTNTVKLPWDMVNGEAVEWDGRVIRTGSLGQSLDDENTGIVLESSSSVELANRDGYFDSIFDTLIWENQLIEFYSWSPVIPITEAKSLFSGIVEKKSFDQSKITFSVKDFVYRLKGDLKLRIFSEEDGTINPSLIGKPKRRIYGKVKNVQLAPIDAILDGYPVTGMISFSNLTATATGEGTLFLKELSPDDELVILDEEGEELKFSIEAINSNNSLTLDRIPDVNIENGIFKVRPKAGAWRFKNRVWHLASHKLSSPEAEIVYVTTSRRFVVDNTQDFEHDDNLTINIDGNTYTASIRRISKNNFVLKNSLYPIPGIGSKFKKAPVSNLFFNGRRLVEGVHWTLSNDEEAIITIKEDAEFLIAPQKSIGVNLVWSSGSRNVTTTATVDLRTIVSVNDWIKKDAVDAETWFEVLAVEAQRIVLRQPFSHSSGTTTGKVKKVDLIRDDSIITADCIGMNGHDGKWIYTASDAVKHLIMHDAGFSSINEESFLAARNDCPWLISMAIPENIGDGFTTIRDTISLINKSVFGSLYGNNVNSISYSILNARRPRDLEVVRDDDLISWKATTDQKIINKVVINYRPQVNTEAGEHFFSYVEHESGFVNRNVGIERTEERTAYIYRRLDAETLAQRVAFYNSLSTCKISLVSNLYLSLLGINDKIYMELDRLFKRFSGHDRRKIGIVSSIKSDGNRTEIELNDLGNIFNRVAAVSPDDQGIYNNSSREDIAKFGFVLDNVTLTPNAESETDLGSNRIG